MSLRPCRRRRASVMFCALLTIITYQSLAQKAPSDEWKAPARAGRRKNPFHADDSSIARGKEVYQRQCLSCHGERGRGDGDEGRDLDPPPHDLCAPTASNDPIE